MQVPFFAVAKVTLGFSRSVPVSTGHMDRRNPLHLSCLYLHKSETPYTQCHV